MVCAFRDKEASPNHQDKTWARARRSRVAIDERLATEYAKFCILTHPSGKPRLDDTSCDLGLVRLNLAEHSAALLFCIANVRFVNFQRKIQRI